MEFLFALLIMGGCFLGLGLGYFLAGKKLRGSCGGVAVKYKGQEIECTVCGKKGSEIDTCDTPENEAVRLDEAKKKTSDT